MLEAVGLGGPDEVALGQAVDLVGPDLETRPAPGQEDLWVVVHLFSQLPDTIGEGKSLDEVAEAVLLLVLST